MYYVAHTRLFNFNGNMWYKEVTLMRCYPNSLIFATKSENNSCFSKFYNIEYNLGWFLDDTLNCIQSNLYSIIKLDSTDF